MQLRIILALIVLAVAGNAGALAQNRVRTETIRPPAAQDLPAGAQQFTGAIKFKADGHLVAVNPSTAAAPDIVTDPTRLPAAVAHTRERILAAARSGDLQKLRAVMETSAPMPIYAFTEDHNPIGYWKANYPESEGIEVLSILIGILETGFVHVDQGTSQEIYLWPYFARTPMRALAPEQKVELFRVITGGDFKEMAATGAYSFYRLGIAPDGTWQFFVSGD